MSAPSKYEGLFWEGSIMAVFGIVGAKSKTIEQSGGGYQTNAAIGGRPNLYNMTEIYDLDDIK